MAVIGHEGSVLTLTTWRGAPMPAGVLRRAGHAEGDVEVGVDRDPRRADLALVPGPAGVGRHPGRAGRAAQCRRHAGRAGRRTPSPGRRPARPRARHRRPGPGRRRPGPSCGGRGPAARRARGRARRVGGAGQVEGELLHARRRTRPCGPCPPGRPPTARVTTAGPCTSTGTSTRSSTRPAPGPDARATVGGRSRRRLEHPGHQRPTGGGGQPGGQVAAVGGGRQDHQCRAGDDRRQRCGQRGGTQPRTGLGPPDPDGAGQGPGGGLGARSRPPRPGRRASATASTAPTGSRPSRATTTASVAGAPGAVTGPPPRGCPR